jgi:hypothetical protein
MLSKSKPAILWPLTVILLALLLLTSARATLAVELSPAELQNPRCLNCHGRPDMATMTAEQRKVMVAGDTPSATAGPRPGLYVDPAMLAGSLHSKIPCTACHTQAEYLPHPMKMGPAQCISCHPTQQQEYSGSVHGKAVAAGHQQQQCQSQ